MFCLEKERRGCCSGSRARIGLDRILPRSLIGLLLRLGNGVRIDGTGNRIAFGNHSRAFSCAAGMQTGISKNGSSKLQNAVFERKPSYRDRWFESVSLQRTVSVSRDFAVPHPEAGLFPRVCGAGQAARSAETGVTR
jgi:hypothetical protein